MPARPYNRNTQYVHFSEYSVAVARSGPQAAVAENENAGWRGVQPAAEPREYQQAAYGLPIGQVPEHGGVLGGGTATLMILGDVCTRSCGFCHIATGRPPTLDLDEPRRVGHAVRMMGLKHIVITSVNRDELPDGGAACGPRRFGKSVCNRRTRASRF